MFPGDAVFINAATPVTPPFFFFMRVDGYFSAGLREPFLAPRLFISLLSQ